MLRKSFSRVIPLVLAFTLIPLQASAAKGGGKPGGPPSGDVPVMTQLDQGYRLSGDGLGVLEHTVDGVRSAFLDDHYLLKLDAFESTTTRTATIDVNSPFDGGPALGISVNDTLGMNVRGHIGLMEVGEIRMVDALCSFTRDQDGKPYRVNFSGSNGTSLVRTERVSESTWIVEAAPGSLARVWDVTRQNRAVLMGLYYMDFQIVLTLP